MNANRIAGRSNVALQTAKCFSSISVCTLITGKSAISLHTNSSSELKLYFQFESTNIGAGKHAFSSMVHKCCYIMFVCVNGVFMYFVFITIICDVNAINALKIGAIT